jgi:hypothetical protein
MRLSFVANSKIHAVTPAAMLPGLSLFSKQSEIGSTLQAYLSGVLSPVVLGEGHPCDRLPLEEMV